MESKHVAIIVGVALVAVIGIYIVKRSTETVQAIAGGVANGTPGGPQTVDQLMRSLSEDDQPYRVQK